MKNLHTILLLTIFSLASFAESDVSFQTICGGNMWHSYATGKSDNFTLIDSEETIIDGKVYYGDVNNDEYYYRQDGKKVYRYTVAKQSEALVIDFGLQVNYIFTHADGSEWMVASVRDTTLEGLSSPRLCIELADVDNTQNTDMWIEGIGSIRYGINPPSSMDDVNDCYLLSFATREWEACVFTFATSNLCNKIVVAEDNGEDSSNKQLHIDVSLADDVLHVEGDAWYDGAGWWYILAEEKDGVINLTHNETVPDADGLSLRSFCTYFDGFNQPMYDVFYNGEYITRVNNNTEHEYIPLLSPSKAWVETDGHIYEEYMIKDTTIWNEKEYCELKATAIELPQGTLVDSNTKEYLREEDKKIFRYLPQNSACPIPEWIATEHLLFDFGAKAGENIVIIDSQEYKLVMTIDSIKQTILDDKERSVFYVSYFNNDEKTGNEIWIEGIGTTIVPLFDEYVRKWGIFVGTTFFHYFYDYNTDFIYPEEKEVIDFSDVSTIPTDANAMTLHREGDVVVAVFPAVSAGETITLYDTTGRIAAVQSVREGATSATIDVAHLPQGIYIARLNSGASCKVVL